MGTVSLTQASGRYFEPSFFTDANQGLQYLSENGAGNGVNVAAGSFFKVGGRRRLFDTNVNVLTLDSGVLTLGTDYYVYCVHDGSGLDFILSANSTYPSGFNAGNSRKIGGFHFGRVRTVAQAYNRDAVLGVQVVPNSVWDFLNRPRSAPEGMAKISHNLWEFIYLASDDGTAWPNTKPVSRYGATPMTGAELYSYYDYVRIAANGGYRLPRYIDEFVPAAWGAPEGSTNAGTRILTGGAGFALPGGNPSNSQYYFVSCLNIDQPSGNIWQVCSDIFDMSNGTTVADGAYAWLEVDQGKSANAQGAIYQQSIKQLIAGCSWGDGANAGARCAALFSAPWYVNGGVGLRCVSDSL